jgi:hypothetical protein
MNKRKMRYLSIFVILFLGGLSTLIAQASIPPVEFLLADADFIVVGEENGDWAGYFASPAGDVNGDGLRDFLIGAPMAGNKECPYPEEEDCTGLEKGEGKAYLVLGKPENLWPSNSMNLANADASFLGCKVNSMTARQLYTAGDVNGDGLDDMLISGWKCGEEYTGKAYLVLGRSQANWGQEFPLDEAADASFLGEHTWDMASYYVSTAGDVNGDGYDDMLITVTHNDEAAEDAGQVYLILGRQTADWGRDFSLANADASFLGEDLDDRLGRAATYIGDINSDGLDDFMIGSVSSDDGGVDAGETYLFFGRSAADWGMDMPVSMADASFVGENAYDESGRRMATAGDVNGDGFDDFIIGASKSDANGPDAGKSYLFLGKPSPGWGSNTSLAAADAIFIGEAKRDQAGRRVSGAGDVNHDGYDDFLIGAPHNSRNGLAAGAAYLIFGRANADWGNQFSLTKADVAFLGKPDIGVAGYDVAGLGDFDGDGIDDFLIAAYGGRNNEIVPGEAYLLIGHYLPADVPFNHWAVDYIEAIIEADISRGCSSDPFLYCPFAETTRAEMAVFLERGIRGSNYSPPDYPPSFEDTIGHWAEDWIETLYLDGITAGCGDGKFCPNDGVTRAQMAVFLLRSKYSAEYSPPDVEATFNDTSGHWAEDWIEQLVVERITVGCGNNNYCPERIVTRAQMAVFITKTFNLP